MTSQIIGGNISSSGDKEAKSRAKTFEDFDDELNSINNNENGDLKSIKEVVYELNSNINKLLLSGGNSSLINTSQSSRLNINSLNQSSSSMATTSVAAAAATATADKRSLIAGAHQFSQAIFDRNLSLSELFSVKNQQQQQNNAAADKNSGGSSSSKANFNTMTRGYSSGGVNSSKASSSNELPDRIYVQRNSLLTEMFRINDIRTIRHIFICIMIVLALQVVFNDIMATGKIELNFNLIRWCFDKSPIVFYTWLYMKLSTVFLVYYCFHYWTNSRIDYLKNHLKSAASSKKHSANSSSNQTRTTYYDTIWLLAFIVYLIVFIIVPATIVVKNRLPTASAFIVLLEQIRMIMKTYAFVRSNVPRALDNAIFRLNFPNIEFGLSSSSSESDLAGGSSVTIKPKLESLGPDGSKSIAAGNGGSIAEADEDEEDDDDELVEGATFETLNGSAKAKKELRNQLKLCPNFSKYLYFLFAPTLVYRDSYPRTKRVRWNIVFQNFAQVIGAILYANYIFERFCIPVFQHFNTEHVSLKMFVHSILNSCLPGTLIFLVAFYSFLHCWMNAFAEMLRFADRMFYKDWWNSENFSNYYRTWNVVVHDWLYTYIYKDLFYLLGKKYRMTSQFCIFFVSALFHEYVLTLAFGFLYPLLFFMFGACGFLCIFLRITKNHDVMNFVMWIGLFIGLGGLMCLYSIEWYARHNCPKSFESDLIDYLLPRSFTCGMGYQLQNASAAATTSQFNKMKGEL